MIRKTLAAATAAAALLAVPASAQQSPAPAPAAAERPKAQESKGLTLKPPTLWGLVNFQYSRTDAPRPASDTSTFELRRARIGARGELTPYAAYSVLWDAADSSLKDGYVAVKNLPYVPGLEVRAGQWKTPFGYEQPESDTKLVWVNNSYAVQSLARGPDSRDLGVGIIGKWKVAGPASVELATSVVNGAGPNRRDDLETKNVWGRAGVAVAVPVGTLRAGGSYGNGRQVGSTGANGRFDGAGAVNSGANGTANDDTWFWFETFGADVTIDTPWLFVAAEWIHSDRGQQVFTTPTTFTRTAFDARGGYVGLYGKTPWNVGPIFRAERFDRNRDVDDNSNERYTLGAYTDLVPVNARLIFNYEIDKSDRAVRTGNRAIAFAQLVF